HFRQIGDRTEFLLRVVRNVLVERGVDCVRGGCQQQRMTIGFAARNVLRADQRAAAALVVDHHRCAQVVCHAFGHGATHEVGGAARREGNDDRDGAVGEAVGQCHRGGGKSSQSCYQTCSQPLLKLHALSPCCSNKWNDVSVLLIISYSEDSRQSVLNAL